MQELINDFLTKMKIYNFSLKISFKKICYLTLVDFFNATIYFME
ncbi:hypothetical protein LEP1GSC059_4576 [Leptospira noguchii serovar Panama str. CZ214]|uniref:Uncharacterized protein n=1 Tax=Leptospira noguchii serovar Panama str. CZ214 TaxID=1001595 RepID=T0GT93_9LEPT|nr:hypothetical protein LEP1GSC059_4576 [Leptospira noguchii serovar Panama str. CZ214]